MKNGYVIVTQDGPSDDWYGFYRHLTKAQFVCANSAGPYGIIVEAKRGLPLFRDDGIVWIVEKGVWVQRLQKDVFGSLERAADLATQVETLQIENSKLHARIAELRIRPQWKGN